jgi:6,7-dimethyl-8-ribityllumazine synthase
MGTTFQGELNGSGLRLAIVVARFNESITTRLLAGARQACEQHGVGADDIDVAWVPGCFELPLTAKKLAESSRYDAVVCLGAVVRGDTPHFEYVAGGTAGGIQQAGLETGLPVVFGVITPNNMDQAMARAGGEKGNKGFDAALTAIEMANLLRSLRPD